MIGILIAKALYSTPMKEIDILINIFPAVLYGKLKAGYNAVRLNATHLRETAAQDPQTLNTTLFLEEMAQMASDFGFGYTF